MEPEVKKDRKSEKSSKSEMNANSNIQSSRTGCASVKISSATQRLLCGLGKMNLKFRHWPLERLKHYRKRMDGNEVATSRSPLADKIGAFTGVLCALKCSVVGAIFAAGLTTSSAGLVAWLNSAAHSPVTVLGLTFVSVMAASRGILYPYFKYLVEAKKVKNQTAFFLGMGAVAGVMTIIGSIVFSGFSLSAMPVMMGSSMHDLHAHHSHGLQHSADFAAIVYDPNGIFGLDKNFFIQVFESAMRTLFFLSSLALASLHLLNLWFHRSSVRKCGSK